MALGGRQTCSDFNCYQTRPQTLVEQLCSQVQPGAVCAGLVCFTFEGSTLVCAGYRKWMDGWATGKMNVKLWKTFSWKPSPVRNSPQGWNVACPCNSKSFQVRLHWEFIRCQVTYPDSRFVRNIKKHLKLSFLENPPTGFIFLWKKELKCWADVKMPLAVRVL